MRIAFLTIAYPADPKIKNLYTDLFEEISRRGHDVTVYCSDESRIWGSGKERYRGRVRVVQIPTGRITKINKIIKALNMFFLEYRFLHKIKADQDEKMIW
jgi:hypothetical protein